LHVSQPAITSQIKALEDELQLALFERTPSGMVLTRAGERLLEQAEKILAATQELKNQARAMAGEVAGKISLGTVSDPEFIRLGELLHGMLKRYPLVELELQQRISGEAFEDVRNGRLNASFYFGELNSPNVTGIRLCDIVYCVAAPAAWKERVENADWNEIAALPWIFAPTVSTHNQMLHELFRNHGAEPTKVVEADQESVMNSLIESGVGIGLMREDQALVGIAEGTIIVWNKERLTTTLQFIFSTEHSQDPTILALIEIMRDIWSLDPKTDNKRKVHIQQTLP
jgi:DNA-binding transcriptional LysR family regulator